MKSVWPRQALSATFTRVTLVEPVSGKKGGEDSHKTILIGAWRGVILKERAALTHAQVCCSCSCCFPCGRSRLACAYRYASDRGVSLACVPPKRVLLCMLAACDHSIACMRTIVKEEPLSSRVRGPYLHSSEQQPCPRQA